MSDVSDKPQCSSQQKFIIVVSIKIQHIHNPNRWYTPLTPWRRWLGTARTQKLIQLKITGITFYSEEYLCTYWTHHRQIKHGFIEHFLMCWHLSSWIKMIGRHFAGKASSTSQQRLHDKRLHRVDSVGGGGGKIFHI